jgi:hypothetical protein
MVKKLYNWRYLVIMSCSGDKWCLHGTYNQEDIATSTPVSFNPETRIVKTFSGSQYELMNCAGNEEQQIRYIMEDIERTKD